MTHSIIDNTRQLFAVEAIMEEGGTWAIIGDSSQIGLDDDVLKVGVESIGARMSANRTGGFQITRVPAINFDNAGSPRGMIALWVQTFSVLRTTATPGITIRVGSSATDYHEYTVATLDGSSGKIYPGGWERMVVDLSFTPINIVGTPDFANADYFALQFSISTGVGGSTKNLYMDEWRYLDSADIGNGLRAFEIIGTPVTPGKSIEELEALSTVQDLGAITKQAGVFYLNMPVKIGDVTATNSTFDSRNELLIIPRQLFTQGFCVIEFVGGAGTDIASWGVESGAPPDSVGSAGGTIKDDRGGAVTILCNNTNITVEFSGLNIDGVDTISWTQTNAKMISTTISNSNSVTLDNGAEIRDGIVTNSTAISGDGAVILASNPTDPEFRDMIIQNCIHAIENENNGPFTIDLRNISFINNSGSDIRHNGTGELTVNVLEGDIPSTSVGAGGTVLVINVNLQQILVSSPDLTGVRVLVTESQGAGSRNILENAFAVDALGGGFNELGDTTIKVVSDARSVPLASHYPDTGNLLIRNNATQLFDVFPYTAINRALGEFTVAALAADLTAGEDVHIPFIREEATGTSISVDLNYSGADVELVIVARQKDIQDVDNITSTFGSGGANIPLNIIDDLAESGTVVAFTFDIPNTEMTMPAFDVDLQELGDAIKLEFSKLENLSYRTFWFWTGNIPVGSFGGASGLNAQMILGWKILWAPEVAETNTEIFNGVIGDENGDPPFGNIAADNIRATRSIDRTPAKSIPAEVTEVTGGGGGSLDC